MFIDNIQSILLVELNCRLFFFADNLQSTLVAMKDCAYETSLVLSAFARVNRAHAALTSECGSMLEEV